MVKPESDCSVLESVSVCDCQEPCPVFFVDRAETQQQWLKRRTKQQVDFKTTLHEHVPFDKYVDDDNKFSLPNLP